ncbi:MAG: hypothetical protein KC613_21665 [Myxococcales bacterium]|nr:hypothetical protein [Myxococcales bacterium]
MRRWPLALILLPAVALGQLHRPVDPAEPDRRAAAGEARLSASPAGRVVLRGIQAHGGLPAWFAGRALAFRYDYAPLNGRPRRDSTQVVDLLASRAYHTLRAPVAGRFAWDGERAWADFPNPHEAAVRFWALTPYYFVGMPFVLGDPGVNLALSDDPAEAAGLPPAQAVRVTYDAGVGDAPDDYYVAYFARDDGRLLAVRYVVSYKPFTAKMGVAHTPEKLLVYSDVRPVGPLRLAHRHDFHAFVDGRRGDKITVATVSDLTYSVPFDEARLAMPAGAHLDRSLDTLR